MNRHPIVLMPAAAVAAQSAEASPTADRTEHSIIEVITGDQAKAIADAIAHTPDQPSARVQIIKPAVNAEPPKRKQFVSRRTFDGLRPRAPRVPTTAEESLALRKAELKRRRKGAARIANRLRQVEILHVRSPGDTDALELPPGQIIATNPAEEPIYEPAAPAPFVVIDVAGETP